MRRQDRGLAYFLLMCLLAALVANFAASLYKLLFYKELL